MHAFTNAFERRWFWIFMAIWAFICLPLPCFYDTDYNPSFFGVPLFIYGWLVYGLFTIVMIGVWGESGRQGLIPCSFATSAITGRVAREMLPVPAKIVRK